MSEMESYRGRLFPVDLGGIGLDSWIKDELSLSELPDYYGSWLEALEDLRYRDFIYDEKNATLYRVQRESLDLSGFIEAERRSDGTVDFIVSYYNGGASFGEVLKSVLRKSEA